MSGIFDSFKTGLSTALTFAPKLVLVTLGLVLLNAVAFYLPYLAWQLWFGKKNNDAAAVPKDTDQSENDDSTPGELQMLENVKAFDVCIICGVIGTVCEGTFILIDRTARSGLDTVCWAHWWADLWNGARDRTDGAGGWRFSEVDSAPSRNGTQEEDGCNREGGGREQERRAGERTAVSSKLCLGVPIESVPA